MNSTHPAASPADRVRALVAALLAFLLAVAGVSLAAPASAAEGPSIAVSPSADLDPAAENVLTVTGSGFTGAGAADGAHVSFGPTSVWSGGTAYPSDGWIVTSWVQPGQVADGAFTTQLRIPAGALDPAVSYHVATSAAHGLSQTDRSLDTFASVTVAQPAPGDGEPGEPGDDEPGDAEPGDGEPGTGGPGTGEPGATTPAVTVSKTADLARDGETITVTGTGFVPNPPATDGTRPPLAGTFGGVYVVFGVFADDWKPSEGAPSSARKVVTQRWGVAEADFGGAVHAGNGGFAIAADGTFSIDITVSASEANDLLDGDYGIYTYPGSGATYAPFETHTPLSFAAEPEPEPEPQPEPEPGFEPALAVFAADGTTPIGDTALRAGDTIVVKGTGYDPAANVGGRGVPIPNTLPQGTYVVFGAFADQWQPSAGAASSSRAVGAQKWALAESVLEQVPTQYQGAIRAQWVDIAADGSFTAELTLQDVVPPAAGGAYGVYTYAAGGVANAAQEQSVALDYTPAPRIAATVTHASPEGLTVRAQGSDFTGVTGAYAAIIEKGTESEVTAGGGYVAFGYWAIPGLFVDGAFDRELLAPADALDPAKQYEIIVWQTHSTPNAETIHARADIAVSPEQWDAVLGAVPTDPGTGPGTGPGQPATPTAPVTVPGGSLRWAISSSFASYVVGDIAKGSITVGGGATRAGNGLFQFGQLAGSTYSAAKGTGTVSYAGSVRFFGHGGVLDVTVSNPQVRITSASSAALYVTSGGSRVHFADLNLGAATRSASGGAVTYTGAPASLTSDGLSRVLAGYRTTLNPVTFTVGSPAKAPSGSSGTVAAAAVATTAADDIPPAPPATTGIELDDAALAALQAGERTTVSARGFEPNEQGIRVVVYSTPVLLGEVTADASGTATWTGTLPATLPDGDHTLTFQGSVDRGIPFTLARASAAAGQCTVEGAELRWGYKESFRNYVEGIGHGGWELDGVVYEFPEYVWTAGTGSVDPDTEAGVVDFGGTIRFTGHDGALDTTLANARVELDGSTGYIMFDVHGETREGEAVELTGVRFVEFAVPAAADGVIAVDAAPATLTEAGAAAFGTYAAGESFDPVTATLPVSADCVTAVAAAAGDGESDASGPRAAVPIAADPPVWPWAVGGIVLVLVAGGVTAMVVTRRRAAEAGSDR